MAVEVKKVYVMGEFSLDPSAKLLMSAGGPVHLTNRPFQVLLYLLENRDRVVSRAELLEALWRGKNVYDDTLTKCIGAIRKALNDNIENPRFIETRWANGYRYVGPFEERFAESQSARQAASAQMSGVIAEENSTAVGAPTSLPDKAGKLARLGLSRRAAFSGIAITLIVISSLTFIFYSSRLSSPDVAALPIRSIAVLPLRNLSGDPTQEYFSDGLSEAFISELSKVEGLKVISRSSVFTFKDRDVSPHEIGQTLGVEAMLEGSVRKSGDTIRVEVRLVSTKDGGIIWASGAYDHALKDILAVQDEIACNVAAGLRLRSCEDKKPQTSKRYTENIEAYQAYLKGRYYWNKRTGDGIKKAIEHFQQAIAIDPNYALAYAGLAEGYSLGVWFVPFEPGEAIEKTQAAAVRAIEIDDSIAEAHAALASAYAIAWNWHGVEKELTRTLEINPGTARAYHHYALFLNYMKRPDEAIAKIKQARDLDPLSLAINSDVGLVYYYARRYDEAIAAYGQALELDPNFAMTHRDLAQAYWQKGMYNEALAEVETAIKLSERNPDYVTLLGLVCASAGRKSEAQKLLHEIDRMAERRYVPPSLKAVLYAALGRKDEAFVWLERAYESRSTHLVNLPVDPTFDPLRSDPRFDDLLRRMGLPN